MSVHPLSSSRAIDPVAQAKMHLAAAHRLAVLHELEEGIDNHFTVTVPGRDDCYLILPFGLHWSEARASDMIVFDEHKACRCRPDGLWRFCRTTSSRTSRDLRITIDLRARSASACTSRR